MEGNTEERWVELCEQAAVEHDSKRLIQLVREIDRLLREKQERSGVYIARSSEEIPLFPTALSGFRSEDGKDFWGRPFSNTWTIRVFQGNDWGGIWKFPNTMSARRHAPARRVKPSIDRAQARPRSSRARLFWQGVFAIA